MVRIREKPNQRSLIFPVMVFFCFFDVAIQAALEIAPAEIVTTVPRKVQTKISDMVLAEAPSKLPVCPTVLTTAHPFEIFYACGE